MISAKKNRISKPFVVLAIAFILSFIGFIKISVLHPTSPDSWTHMAIGKFIVEKKSIPNHTDISYKDDISSSLEWISHSWLIDLSFYIAGRVDTLFSGIFMLLPNLIISLYLLSVILKRLAVERSFMLMLITLPILMANVFWKIHPLTFTIPLFLIIILSYFKWREGHWRYMFFVPLIFILFANIYGGLIIIPTLFLMIILITETGIRIINKFFQTGFETIGKMRFLIFALISSLVCSLINPYTLRIWFYPFTFFGILERKHWLSSLGGTLTLLNQNFLRTSHSAFLYDIFLIYMLFIFFGLVYLFIKKFEIIKKYYFFLPLIFFLLLPVFWIRFIPLSVFASLPLIGLLAVSFSDKNQTLLKRYLNFKFLFPVIIIFLSSYLLLNSSKVIFTPPEKQIELIKKFNLPLNILTTPDLTGYTFYSFVPAKIGIDAQDDIFDENELITTISSAGIADSFSEDAIKKITDENSIQTILVNKNLWDIAYIFNQIDDWALIYFDDNGFLFTKKESVDETFLHDNEIKYLDLTRELGFNPDQATKAAQELEKFTRKYPENILALGQLANIYRINGDLKAAEGVLAKIPNNKFTYITMTEMGRLRAAEGYCESSEQWFLKALHNRQEQNFSRAVLDLAVLYAGCLNNKQKAEHYFERYNSFQLSSDEREKLRKITKDFGIELSD